MHQRSPVTNEMILRAIKEKLRNRKKTPKPSDIEPKLGELVMWRFGSWENAVRRAKGMDTYRHRWSDQELLGILSHLWKGGNKFPAGVICTMNPTLFITITKRFGGIDEALERAVGSSRRILIFEVIGELTNRYSNEASTREILHELRKRGTDTSPGVVIPCLLKSCREGFIRRRRIDNSTIWALTAEAMTLMNNLQGCTVRNMMWSDLQRKGN